jgi:hypothetical protein
VSRKGLAAIAFIMGLIAAPIGVRFFESCVNPAVAQDRIYRVGINQDNIDEPHPIPGRENQDLIVVDPVPVDPKAVYLELCQQKALLLTPEALERETQALRQELVELEATQKLRKAEWQLQQLIDEHPDTSAAMVARGMLQSIRIQPHPQDPEFIHRRKLVPVPDDVFDRTPDADNVPQRDKAPTIFDEVAPPFNPAPQRSTPTKIQRPK